MSPKSFSGKWSLERLCRLALAVGAVLAAIPVGWQIARSAIGDPAPPLWDPAKYLAAGARLAAALAHGDLLRFAAGVHALSNWPLFPLLETPLFLLAGPGEAVAEGLSGVLFVLLVGGAAVAGFELGREAGATERERLARGLLAGGVSGALFLCSPFFRLFGGLVMLEVPGALLLMVAIASYSRSVRSTAAPGAEVRSPRQTWRLACLAATALFFLKHNYGLLWLLPMGLGEVVLAYGGVEGVVQATSRALRRIPWRRPWTLFVVAYLGALGLVTVFGPPRLRVGPISWHTDSPGSPLAILLLLAVLRYALLSGPRRAARAGVRRLGPRARTAFYWTALPIGIWLALPPHLLNLAKFLRSRTSDLELGAGFAYYPRVFVERVAPAPRLGWLCLALAVVALALWHRQGTARRVVVVATALAAGSLLVHPYKVARFVSVAASPILLLASVAAADLLVVAAGRLSRWRERDLASTRMLVALSAAVATVGLVLAALQPLDRERWHAGRAAFVAPAPTLAVVAEIADLAAAADGETVLLGTWNGLSPSLVEWTLRQRHPDEAERRLPREPIELSRARDPDLLLDRARSDPDIVRLLSIEPLPGGFADRGTFAQETAWLAPARQALEADPRFDLVREQQLPTAGYRLRVYDKRIPTLPEAAGLRCQPSLVLARTIHESPTAATHASHLAGVLSIPRLRRTARVRLGAPRLWAPTSWAPACPRYGDS